MPAVAEDTGLLLVEAAGICGNDVELYSQESPAPRILGHENVGRIAKLGRIAAARWGVAEGDLVALEEYLPCGHCNWCRSGEYRHCAASDPRRPENVRYGRTATAVAPSLWGGYSQYMHLPANVVMHPVPAAVPAVRAAMALPVGNGFQWTHLDGGAGPGDAVLVQGPGQQGLGCAMAAREVGAALVIVTGTDRDADRLRVARELGAETVNVDKEDLAARIADLTGGEGVDVAVDASGGSEQTVLAALDALKRKNGTAILQPTPMTRFPLDVVDRKAITVRMARGHSYRSVEMALQLLAGERYPFQLLSTHEFDLEHVHEALETAAGANGARSIHVVVTPGRS